MTLEIIIWMAVSIAKSVFNINVSMMIQKTKQTLIQKQRSVFNYVVMDLLIQLKIAMDKSNHTKEEEPKNKSVILIIHFIMRSVITKVEQDVVMIVRLMKDTNVKINRQNLKRKNVFRYVEMASLMIMLTVMEQNFSIKENSMCVEFLILLTISSVITKVEQDVVIAKLRKDTNVSIIGLN